MPTGYTHPVQTGEITTVQEFGVLCARAFGATILMRDEPLDKPIPVFEPDAYYLNGKAQAEAKLRQVEAMSDAECEAAALSAYQAECDYRREQIRKDEAERSRYEAMLRQVDALEVPESHANFKEFMRSQLTESIKFDCGTSFGPLKQQTGAEWREEQVDHLRSRIERCEREYAEEVERTRGRNEWIATLRDILSQTPAMAE